MANIIGDLLWNYFLKPYQRWMLDNAYRYNKEELMRGNDLGALTPEIILKDYGVTDQGLREEFIARWATLPEKSESPVDAMSTLMETLSGQAARAQLEAVAGVSIGDTEPVTQRLFEQLGIVTNVGSLAAAAEMAGAAIPTTNLQHAGLAVRGYMDIAGLTQITGFGYGMLFSNIVSPLVTQELNAKVKTALPDPLLTIRARRRGFLTEAQKNDIFSRYGFSDDYRTAIEKTEEFYPQPQDFIRFAVRDTFNDAVVSEYGYDNDFPSAILEKTAQAGISEEWMKHFWRAHWEMPSVQMGYEMLHRDIITTEQLTLLLRISDVAPTWIPRLIEMSYSPYTRVDTRRLFVDGVITREEVKRNYKDIGYDEEHAEKLTEWTCKSITAEKKEKTRDLTESKIMQAYTYGEKSADETKELLTGLNYDEEETALIIALADYQMTFDELDQEWKVLKAEYLAGIVSDSTAGERMAELKLPQRQQEKWLRQLKREAYLAEVAAFVKALAAAKKKEEAE